MNPGAWARRHDQTAVGGAREGRNASLDFVRVADIERGYLHPKGGRHSLDDGELAGSRTLRGIPKDRHPRNTWRDFPEQLQPFSAEGEFHRHESGVDSHIAADDPARLRQRLLECSDPGLIVRIVRARGQQRADAPHAPALLRPRRERPRRRRAAEQRDELAPPHVEPPLPEVGPPHVQLATGWLASLTSGPELF